jgi:hypothetical protein
MVDQRDWAMVNRFSPYKCEIMDIKTDELKSYSDNGTIGTWCLYRDISLSLQDNKPRSFMIIVWKFVRR